MTDWLSFTPAEHAAKCKCLQPQSGNKGDPEFEDSWEALTRRLRYLAWFQIRQGSHHLSKEDIEDILQEVFLKLYRQLQRYDASRSFQAFFHSIVNSVRIDWMREQRPEWDHRTLVDDLRSLRVAAENKGVPVERLMEILAKRFGNMHTMLEQRVLQMLVDEKSIDEISHHLGITQYAVKCIRNGARELADTIREELRL